MFHNRKYSASSSEASKFTNDYDLKNYHQDYFNSGRNSLNSFGSSTSHDSSDSYDSCDSYDSYDSSESNDDSIDNKYEVCIPKIIMQTWKNRDIPEKWKTSPESIKKYMPDWEYVLMTDEDNRNFVRKHFPDFLPYYDNFKHDIQRADAIRYMWLYVNGGIYMDLDYEMRYPLDKLFTGDSEVFLVSSGNIGSYVTNSFMASKPKCKLWLEMIEAMKQKPSWYYIGKHIEVMNTTGPVMLTHVIKKSKTIYTMIPGKYINPCSVCNLNCDISESYLKPLEGSSWVSYDTKLYNFFMCNWKRVAALIFILLILLLLIMFVIWMGYI